MREHTNIHPSQKTDLWVVFSGETELPWLRRLLRPGFRHCYALINDGQRWMTFDPLAHKIELAVHHHAPVGFDLPAWLRQRGLKVLAVAPTNKPEVPKPLPPAPFTCVEAMKRLIGLRDWRIWTPYQLYQALKVSA